ncbi:hypothetical protein DE146DRAFT_738910 [Phaeosphaeria sp. MPI-PUGE-AT-0046c]|nr:hypothetical protein DE146DRAFT_738910 [Phaeosphaeria sp. MPI-PUGE-AT-0046c]
MAVLDEVPGLKVQVMVRDKPLREYDDGGAKVPKYTVERYVEAQTNACFEIRFAFTQPFPRDRAISMLVTIDGRDVDEPLIRPAELFDVHGHTSIGSVYKSGSTWKVRRYRFRGIEIEENDGSAVSEELKAKLQSVGIITCGFYFLDSPQPSYRHHKARHGVEVSPPIDEKALKGDALSHQAILGATETTEMIDYYDAGYADDGYPFATFHFYYRSMDALKDLHIVGRTPETRDLLYDDGGILGQMNREQLQAMCRRLLERDERRTRLKRELSSPKTVVGDDNEDPGHSLEIEEVRCVDRRAAKRARNREQLVGGAEVIVLDD